MAKLLTAALAFLACCFFTPAHAAGFDCAKASSSVEKLICATPELSALDAEMAEAYKAALPRTDLPPGALATQQKDWLKDRSRCLQGQADNGAGCLAFQYRQRINFLHHPQFCRLSRLDDCNNTNQLMWEGGDKALQAFLAPEGEAIIREVGSLVGGAPEDIQTLPNGWKLAAACRAHDCGAKGAMILTAEGQVVAAAALTYRCARMDCVEDYGLRIYLGSEADRDAAVEALSGWAKAVLAKEYVPPSLPPIRLSETQIQLVPQGGPNK